MTSQVPLDVNLTATSRAFKLGSFEKQVGYLSVIGVKLRIFASKSYRWRLMVLDCFI